MGGLQTLTLPDYGRVGRHLDRAIAAQVVAIRGHTIAGAVSRGVLSDNAILDRRRTAAKVNALADLCAIAGNLP
jgi:hypothetical protein